MLKSKNELHYDKISYFNFTIENTIRKYYKIYISREKEDMKGKARTNFFRFSFLFLRKRKS